MTFPSIYRSIRVLLKYSLGIHKYRLFRDARIYLLGILIFFISFYSTICLARERVHYVYRSIALLFHILLARIRGR